MALMMLCFTQCKPTPEGGDENSRKVKVSCSIPMGKNNRSDFSELMTEGNVRWSDGRECVYLAIHGENPQIIELESWADGNPLSLEFEGEAAEGLIVSGEEYDIWYFGHSQQLETPYYNLSDDGESLTGSIAKQSGRLEDLGYSHIATTKVTAVTDSGDVKLNLKGTLANQIAIALLDLENVDELYGDAILGTEYALSYNGERYELDVTADNNAKIEVESASGISYVVLLPNDKNETMIKHKKGDKTYAYTFHSGVKGNKVYYRTATNDKVALKWEEIEEEPETPDNNHEYVDLGLPSGLLWATCNLGANAPEEYGNYYAWGETATKAEYNYSNCPTHGLTYSQLQSQGYIDGEGNLTAQYDAAAANWGGDWRMPTKSEMQELIDKCTWTWTTKNGVNGYNVEGPNGNSIFLPAAGYRDGSSLKVAGSYGGFWGSTPNESNSDFAFALDFGSSDHYMKDYGGRSYGRSVRPVCGGNNAEPEEPEEPETPETPDSNNHEYVDLGLSVKWATCNVGATSPEAYGDYFAWGETTTKSEYTEENSATLGLSISELESQGYIDGEGNLNPQYDAATANWGGDWRMPTRAEQEELLNNCTWTWTTQNGVSGYNVEGPNGNSIFLPGAAYRYGSSLYSAQGSGFYWGSTPYEGSSNYAYFLYFNSGYHFMRDYGRLFGHSVRPVLE